MWEEELLFSGYLLSQEIILVTFDGGNILLLKNIFFSYNKTCTTKNIFNFSFFNKLIVKYMASITCL